MKFNGKEIALVKKKSAFDYILYSLIIVGGIIIDQITKYLCVLYLKAAEDITIIKGHLLLSYVENRGAAFGMLKDDRWVFIIASTVTIIAMTLYLYLGHADKKLFAVSVAMIVSGGIGNMIDRLALGYVVDFIKVPWFATFNGADSFVCVGAGLLILALVLDMIEEYKREGKIS